ncbi:MAG: tRNA uridine-5-carboxymethylaminomethyl(34) synthesis GTPase MnmE [Bacteroidia bacterium]|nr:tRNA uridine-5-carboxymethylaminomethyl(34) synthesis GTPase MnmE [Bacteroidia bacterium]
MTENSTICAIATPSGSGALAIIRLSGKNTFEIIHNVFNPAFKGRYIAERPNTVLFGTIQDGTEILDEALISIFKAPNSYTGEDSVEISCHGSPYIQQQILQLLIRHGASMAKPGEFTMRAFINNKLDLSQAEAVADLIASNSKASHDLAIKQMRGGFSSTISVLRKQLIHFSSLIELELDFSEEDVEFAKRDELIELLEKLNKEITLLIQSFAVGNVMKNGIPVAIIGNPNVGKSTLLNILLNEDKAIVSDIPGTTRDAIEDTIVIKGISFRFIDTAGLREPGDKVENMGIEKTYEKIEQACIILYLFDISQTTIEEIISTINDFKKHIHAPDKKLIVVANMIDKLVEMPKGFRELLKFETVFISAKRRENINLITESLLKSAGSATKAEGTIVSNARHYEALMKTNEALLRVKKSCEQKIAADFIAQDLREALHYLGSITGEITSDDILKNIFANFCIGK